LQKKFGASISDAAHSVVFGELIVLFGFSFGLGRPERSSIERLVFASCASRDPNRFNSQGFSFRGDQFRGMGSKLVQKQAEWFWRHLGSDPIETVQH
jgi:hypothetical protein